MSDDILMRFGGSSQNSLSEIIDMDKVDERHVLYSELGILKHSPYFDINSVNTLLNKDDQFNIFSLNVCSLPAKLDELKIILDTFADRQEKIHAICLQESWLDDEVDLSVYHIDGFHMISHAKTCSAHGGLVIYLSNEFSFEELSFAGVKSGWEGQFIKVRCGLKDITIGNIYRPPKDLVESYTAFTDELSDILSMLSSTNMPVVIAGDFNIDLLRVNEKASVADFFDSITSNGFFPRVTLPTRLSRNRATLIDNFFCNICGTSLESKAGIFVTQLSDHFPYFISLNLKFRNKKTKKTIEIYRQDAESIARFKQELKSRDLCTMLEMTASPCENYKKFIETLLTIKERHLSKKCVKFRKTKHKLNPWITMGIIKSIKYRDKMYRQLKLTDPSSSSYEDLKANLKSYNRILKRNIYLAKRQYYYDRFSECGNDMKKTWGTLKDILNLNKNKNTFPETICNGDKDESNRLEICEKFNTFFINNCRDLQKRVHSDEPSHFGEYLETRSNITFSFSSVNVKTVGEIIDELKPKQSSGLDHISVNLLKLIKDEIIGAITLLVNQTLATGIFPDDLKVAKVSPIYKKGDKNDINNYRPISILPAISKVFEKIIAKQLSNFFEENKLLTNCQYGFRSQHSTEYAVLEIVDRTLFAMDRNESPVHIYLDLSKAFDTIGHDILIEKLQHYGIKGAACNLIKNYLSNRMQCVSIDNVTSSLQNVTTGVPQGSILGPLLFSIYINDMEKASNFFNYISYADDTTLFFSLNPFMARDPSRINSELSKISDWLCANKLVLNVKKSKFMVFHTPKRKVVPPKLIINDENLECVEEFDLLGIVIDKHLTWKSHLNKISNKVSKVIGIMSKLRISVPQNILRIVYTSLVLPHLTYGLLIWGFEHHRLFKLQKKQSEQLHLANTMPIPSLCLNSWNV